MNDFIKHYCQLINQLEQYKKNIISNQTTSILSNEKLKQINEIDNLIFEKILKLEEYIQNKK